MAKFCKVNGTVDAAPWERDAKKAAPLLRRHEGQWRLDGDILVIAVGGTEMACKPGDWIVEEDDLIYPCKAAVFEATFAPVEPGGVG